MTIAVIIEDQEVAVGDDFSISLTYINPLFTEKKINEAYSFSFSLPSGPALNSILKNSKRVDTSTRNFILNAKIKMNGVLMIQGKITLTKSSSNYYSCNIFNDGKDLYQFSNESHLSDHDYGSIKLWDVDNPPDNVQKLIYWSQHYGLINDQSPEEGAYKFPMIKAYYDHPSIEDNKVLNDGLNYVFWKGGGVNIGFWNAMNPGDIGVGQTNQIIPFNEFPNKLNWINTYSPCMRIEHMLEVVLNEAGLSIRENHLELIREFKRLTNFSGYVCDEMDENQTTLNVHGSDYELSEFTPDVNTWELFNMLIELFSVVYFVRNDRTIDIKLSRDILNQEAIDYTDKANPEAVINKGELQVPISIAYDITREDLKILNDELIGGWSMENSTSWMYKSIGEENEEGTKIKHRPLRTLLNRPKHYFGLLNFYSHWNEYTTQCSGFYDNLYLSFAFLKPRGAFGLDGNWLDKKEQLMLSSRVFPEDNEKSDRFNLLLFHGRAISKGFMTQINPDGSCQLENPGGSGFDLGVYLTCNLDNTSEYNINGHDTDHPNIAVSDKTIYLSDNPDDPNKGTYSNYHEPLYEFTNSTEDVSKTLYLDAHEIHELSKFEKVKHRINSPDGSFEGIIKEFKVQLTKHSISPTSVTYLKQLYENN